MPETRPVLLLTRPGPASERLAEDVTARVAVDVVRSPLLKIVHHPLTLPGDLAGIVLTSANGVRDGLPPGLPAWCVGDATAEAARRAGLDAISAGGDADALVALMVGRAVRGPLVHLRGAHARGDVAARLGLAGIPCDDIVAYDQVSIPLSPEARAVLNGTRPVIAPVYSPRTAALLAAEGPCTAPIRLVAISPAAAAPCADLAPAETLIAEAPNGAAMLALTCRAIAEMSGTRGPLETGGGPG